MDESLINKNIVKMPKTVSKHTDFSSPWYGTNPKETWKSQKDRHLQNKENNLLLISAGFEAKHVVCL